MWDLTGTEKLPSEFWDALKPVLTQATGVVDIGWRIQSTTALHDNLHHHYGVQDIHLVDIFETNLLDYARLHYHDHPWVKLNLGDVRHISAHPWNVGPSQLVIWQGGPEHLEKNEAWKVLHDQQNAWPAILVEMPVGVFEQGALGGNEAERHLSTWHPEELSAAGWLVADHPDWPGEHFLGFWQRGG